MNGPRAAANENNSMGIVVLTARGRNMTSHSTDKPATFIIAWNYTITIIAANTPIDVVLSKRGGRTEIFLHFPISYRHVGPYGMKLTEHVIVWSSLLSSSSSVLAQRHEYDG